MANLNHINLDNIIDEVIKQLEIGIVKTHIKYKMKVHSNVSSHFEITPTLNLKDKNQFYNCIKEYISMLSEEDERILYDSKYVKSKIAYLFANMSFEDFNNPIEYIRRIINFNQNKLLDRKTTDYIDSLESKIHINISSSELETPYCFECALVSDKGYYPLPTISYGISDGICYVYAIQDHNKHLSNPFNNKIKRKLYKINGNVSDSETEEYKDYKEGKSEYYPENISDVSPSAVLVLTIFLNEIEKHGINKIQVVPYLPVRFENYIKTIAYNALQQAKDSNLNELEKRELYMSKIKEQMYIQSNITEKFIRTFRRVAHHFDNVSITSYPMELDDKLHIKLSKFQYSDNEILNEIIKSNNKTL